MSCKSGRNHAHNFKSASACMLIQFWNNSPLLLPDCAQLGWIIITKYKKATLPEVQEKHLFQYTITFIETYSVVHFSFKNRSLLELKLPVVTPFYSITMKTKFWPRYWNFRFQMQLNNRHYTENRLIVVVIDLIWSLFLNRPFYSCLLSDLAFGWQRG